MGAGFVDAFLAAFITLFVIIDPPGIAPVFASLTQGAPQSHKRAMAIKGSLVATVLLVFFAFMGDPFLSALGISLDALRIAGGILLFVIGFEMVMEKRTERKQDAAEKIDEFFDDVSVFPIAIPLVSGPGAIASIILLMADYEGNMVGQIAVMSGLAATMLITFVTFLIAGPLLNLMGPTVTMVLTRVLGIIVAALATQFVLDGVMGYFRTGL